MIARKLIHSLFFFTFVLLLISCRDKQVIKNAHSNNVLAIHQKNVQAIRGEPLLEPTKNLKIENIEIKEENDLAKLSINISYPQINADMSNKSKRFNNAIRRYIVIDWANVIRDSAFIDYKKATRFNRKVLLGYSLSGGCDPLFEYWGAPIFHIFRGQNLN